MEKKLRHKIQRNKSLKWYIGIAGLTMLCNMIAWLCSDFCDVYLDVIFPVWVNTYGRFMGIFPFSVGEWLILIGILLTFMAAGCLVVTVVSPLRKKNTPGFVIKYLKGFSRVLLGVWVIMTLNCTILYHASTFAERYLSENQKGQVGESDGTGLEDFVRIRNKIALRCNELSQLVERDSQGYIVDYDSKLMQDRARLEMQNLGEEFPRLSGFYPRPKPLFFSDFMCQQDMLGWYFPFSLEANYNQVAYITNQPASMCHELAHLKGFIYEDEANFISYLACTKSEDIYFEYSGYLSVLGYVERDLRRAAETDPEGLKRACEGQGLIKIDEPVYQDHIFITEEERERIEGKAVLETETVSQATEKFLDTSLKANGVSDGIVSYSRIVELLLKYESMQK